MKTYKQLQERINMAKAKMGDVIKDFQDSDAPQFKGKSPEKRRQMAIAAKMASEEVEDLDELNAGIVRSMGKSRSLRKIVPGLGKNEAGERAKDEKYHANLMRQSDPKYNPDHDYDVRTGKASEKAAKRYSNIAAGKKPFGEEVELDEGRMKDLAMDIESMGEKDFRAKHKKSKQEMKDALKSESSDLKPFIVVHAKHGKFETHAASTYEAAKNAAAHWKTKKGTAGMDVHRADITHSTQHVG